MSNNCVFFNECEIKIKVGIKNLLKKTMIQFMTLKRKTAFLREDGSVVQNGLKHFHENFVT